MNFTDLDSQNAPLLIANVWGQQRGIKPVRAHPTAHPASVPAENH